MPPNREGRHPPAGWRSSPRRASPAPCRGRAAPAPRRKAGSISRCAGRRRRLSRSGSCRNPASSIAAGRNALAFPERGLGIGMGVEEDVAVVEGRDELDRERSIPLPKTSPDMSPTPATVTDSYWMSMSISRKWRFTACAARRRRPSSCGRSPGCRPTRRRRPASGPSRPDRRWRCRKTSRSLVGGDDQIGIVAVAGRYRPRPARPRCCR